MTPAELFQLRLGAVMDLTRSGSSSAGTMKTGMTPYVLPSLGTVVYIGSGKNRDLRGGGPRRRGQADGGQQRAGARTRVHSAAGRFASRPSAGSGG